MFGVDHFFFADDTINEVDTKIRTYRQGSRAVRFNSYGIL